MIVYLAHPVAPRPEDVAAKAAGLREIGIWDEMADPEGEAAAGVVRDNLERARRWLRWLVENTSHAICVPWMPYVDALGEDGGSFRDRGLADDLLILGRCDAIVLCGGRVSGGMNLERVHAQRAGKRIVNLTGCGDEPPAEGTRMHDAALTRLAELGEW